MKRNIHKRSSLSGLIKFLTHHLTPDSSCLSSQEQQEKEPLHLPGDADRFHGLLSQRAIEVPWLRSLLHDVAWKGQRIDNDLLVGSFLEAGQQRTS